MRQVKVAIIQLSTSQPHLSLSSDKLTPETGSTGESDPIGYDSLLFMEMLTRHLGLMY